MLYDLLYEKIVTTVELVQKTSPQDGAGKKKTVKNHLRKWASGIENEDIASTYQVFIDECLDDLIDMIVMLVKNKRLIKLFKKKCSCLPSIKRCEESDQIVDELLNGS